jgi:hypothetical protein
MIGLWREASASKQLHDQTRREFCHAPGFSFAFTALGGMSAFGGKADMTRTCPNVCF